MKKECIAMLLAGGQGSRLYVLTKHMAKPAIPFGGKYRIIDFPLSNCVNSGIDTVGVLTQYRPLELNSYIGNGQSWDLDRISGGVHILPPYVREGSAGTWYKGTANAIYQNMDFIEQYNPEYVLILSGDHVYKMDYSEMLDAHKKQEAACTISVLEVPREEASRFGIMNVNEEDLIYEFEEKPKAPKSNLASMGIYIFTWSKLREYLIADEANARSKNDFGADVIPAMLGAGERMLAFRFSGYWKDVGTIESLWDANMDMLSRNTLNLLDQSWPIYARSPTRPPHYTGNEAIIHHSIITQGCEIEGTVENSVLFHSVTVETGAEVRYSILMPGVTVEAGAVVEYAIVAEGSRIGAGARVGAPPGDTAPEDWGVAVVGGGAVKPGRVIPPKVMVDRKGKEVVR
ncbi:glucose-1-phosphate adenylyltransferase [Papillibacter cinnamivorans]|uniref:Glucose-1-phosphate adenylyltransferase n=1 Tax=Papillibacter cinnamivorans DSM 12816 TaxID=1122930 RepID=A0A1W2A598_9FIRM|nr:glucose-1-phosphate adenylyltransferase [Papillibacter cinnamivorans]SMC55816.1 glucose-1-phosphate adenylyltransferase [Papillibacter cinnamivorans DSM 12816]